MNKENRNVSDEKSNTEMSSSEENLQSSHHTLPRALNHNLNRQSSDMLRIRMPGQLPLNRVPHNTQNSPGLDQYSNSSSIHQQCSANFLQNLHRQYSNALQNRMPGQVPLNFMKHNAQSSGERQQYFNIRPVYQQRSVSTNMNSNQNVSSVIRIRAPIRPMYRETPASLIETGIIRSYENAFSYLFNQGTNRFRPLPQKKNQKEGKQAADGKKNLPVGRSRAVPDIRSSKSSKTVSDSSKCYNNESARKSITPSAIRCIHQTDDSKGNLCGVVPGKILNARERGNISYRYKLCPVYMKSMSHVRHNIATMVNKPQIFVPRRNSL